MKQYHLTNKAIEDLNEIWLYTVETWSEKQADTYYCDLIGAIKVIAQRPMYLDKNYDEISILSSIKNIFVFSGKIPIFAIVFEPKLKAS